MAIECICLLKLQKYFDWSVVFFITYHQTVSLFCRSSCTCKVSVCISLTRTYHMKRTDWTSHSYMSGKSRFISRPGSRLS